VEQVIVATLEETLRGATHWSIRAMAKKSGAGRISVNRMWHAFGLHPRRSETFQLSDDPLLIEKVRDIVGLYMHPPDHAVPFCVDEQSQIQALDHTGTCTTRISNASCWRQPSIVSTVSAAPHERRAGAVPNRESRAGSIALEPAESPPMTPGRWHALGRRNRNGTILRSSLPRRRPLIDGPGLRSY
jgi:hypothetical protein